MSTPTKPLAELVADAEISYGIVQPGATVPGGTPIVRVGDVKNGVINTDAPLTVDAAIEQRHARTRLTGGEVLLTIVGSVGEAAVVPKSLKGWNVARAIAVLRPQGVPAEWLRLCFESPDVKHQIDSLLNTTVQATLNLRDLKNIQIPTPNPEKISAVLDVITALDDKLTIINSIAESTDSWIRKNYELLNKNAASTSRRKISDLLGLVKAAIQVEDLQGDEFYLGLEHLPRRSIYHNVSGTGADVTSSKSKFESGDILFGRLRPYFHKVVTARRNGICSTDILVLRPSNSQFSGFALAMASSEAFVAHASAASEGTRMPRSSWKDISEYSVHWPGDTAVADFSRHVSHLNSYISSLLEESRILVELRDSVSRALLSEEISVRSFEDHLQTLRSRP